MRAVVGACAQLWRPMRREVPRESQTAHRARTSRAQGRLIARLLVPLALAGAVSGAGVGAATMVAARKSANEQMVEQAATVARLVDGALERRHGAAGVREVRAISQASGASVRLIRSRNGRPAVHPKGTSSYSFRLTASHRRSPQVVVITLSDAPVVAAGQRALYWSLGAIFAAAVLLLVLARRLVRGQILRPLRALGDRIRGVGDAGGAASAPIGGAVELAGLVDDVDGIAASMTELASQAATDPLTGTANRRAFDAALMLELGRARRSGSSLALVIFDFDGFKAINDRHGHSAGDDLLKEVTEKLLAHLRATDMLARVGGDEFALLLPDMRPERAHEAVERMRRGATVTVDDVELTWCAGVACYPAHAEDAKTLYECADGALYAAKETGDGCSVLFDPAHVSVSRTQGERAEIAAILEREDSITPVYQPIVSLATGKVSGYEALARFPTPPDRRPDDWFALAHRVGLGAQLEARAVERALASPDRPDGTYLSFNLSPSAIASPHVLAVLPEDLNGLVIEITEHERVTDEGEFHQQLAPLRARGARIAVDDAGAGYAGLQQVMRVHPDIIKLDRSLVADVDSDPAKAALIDAFVRFARGTGAVVCAEGIETAGELRVVADLDVTYGQGFGLARPAAPWARPSPWVSSTLSRSGLRSTAAVEGQEETGETRLAQACAALARAGSIDELPKVEALLAAELGADDVCLLRFVPGEDSALEAVSQRRWLGYGTQLRERHYFTLANVMASGDSVQVIDGDAANDGGELALLRRAGGRAMLLAPVIAGGRPLGVLMLVRQDDRRWARAEVGRARVLAFGLAPLLAQQPAVAPAAAAAG
jgi:diguanylate cyclase (GGDEF)-like protein